MSEEVKVIQHCKVAKRLAGIRKDIKQPIQPLAWKMKIAKSNGKKVRNRMYVTVMLGFTLCQHRRLKAAINDSLCKHKKIWNEYMDLLLVNAEGAD